MYIENHGEMNFTNIENSDVGVMKLKKRSWTNKVYYDLVTSKFKLIIKGAYEVIGEIRDSTGTLRYNIKARWDKNFIIIDSKTKQETVIW